MSDSSNNVKFLQGSCIWLGYCGISVSVGENFGLCTRKSRQALFLVAYHPLPDFEPVQRSALRGMVDWLHAVGLTHCAVLKEIPVLCPSETRIDALFQVDAIV